MGTPEEETTNGKNPLIVDNDDGTKTIRFPEKRKPMIDGTEVKELNMREPTVGDSLVGRAQGKGDDAETEIATIAMLLELAPETLRGFSLRHYGRLQDAYAAFLG